MLERIEQEEGIARSGVVLQALMKLKQVCNHPAHLLKDRSRLNGRSDKLARLEEILEEAVAEGDKALCFTQFAEFGHQLRAHLQERLGREILFLHGGTPKATRDQMVQRFQSPEGPSLFVLSLKAGGTGLNLTAANHVIHFDRWSNPAVENQATDRAFRIGQRKNVQVRKLTCVGALEERIDQLIAEKKDLAEQIVGRREYARTGQVWSWTSSRESRWRRCRVRGSRPTAYVSDHRRSPSGRAPSALGIVPAPLHSKLLAQAANVRSGSALTYELVGVVLELAQHGFEVRSLVRAPGRDARGELAECRHALAGPVLDPRVDLFVRRSERHPSSQRYRRHVLAGIGRRSARQLGLDTQMIDVTDSHGGVGDSQRAESVSSRIGDGSASPTTASTCAPWRSRNAGPTPLMCASWSIDVGRTAAISSSVRLCATV